MSFNMRLFCLVNSESFTVKPIDIESIMPLLIKEATSLAMLCSLGRTALINNPLSSSKILVTLPIGIVTLCCQSILIFLPPF